jgi:triacylglycerol lipase
MSQLALSGDQAAALALLVLYAEDQYNAAPASLSPTPDPRLSPRWRVLGHLTAVDCLFRRRQTVAFGEDTCYGYLAQEVADPTMFAVALRGTEGILEWILDGEFTTVPHPVAGRVETGFWSIYASLTYRPVAGEALPAAIGLAAAVGAGKVVVLGHSLGSALAAYLTFDLAAALGPRAQGCYFASPRPGDANFARAFGARVTSSVVYNYELDVVPRVPRGFGYTDLASVHWIGIQAAKAHIKFDLGCHHHLISYLAMLDYLLLDWAHLPACDQGNVACIKGPV